MSVLCPSYVDTRLMDSARNRPDGLNNEVPDQSDPEIEERLRMTRQRFQEGMSPQEIADDVFTAITEGKFYILTHPEVKSRIQMRMDDILEERDPTDYSM